MRYFVKFIKKILGINNPSKFEDLISPEYTNYVERDTRCDLCDNKGECEEYLIDCTRYEDTRRHGITSHETRRIHTATKEMTIEEIEEELGYKVKIVDNKKGERE